MRTANAANREKFIKAAVSELEEHGVSDFSIRRVAKRCGVSCSAPYKHFEGRNELMVEVIRYINRKWLVIWQDTVNAHRDETVREQIVAVCMAYITFLCTYPEYQTILNMNDRAFPAEMLAEKGELTCQTSRLIDEYCRSVDMPDETRQRKQFVVRSMLFGASIMINSGAMPFDSRTIDMIRENIEREFEIE